MTLAKAQPRPIAKAVDLKFHLRRYARRFHARRQGGMDGCSLWFVDGYSTALAKSISIIIGV